MIHKRHFLFNILIFLTSVVFIVSCKKDGQTEYEYFVSDEFITDYSTADISNLLTLASVVYPELSGLRSYISHPVDIYKIIYTTEVDNQDISASGLVCVPSDGGDFPMLSFQNGTNTVNSQSPSEYPGNPSYQLAEIVASLGFVVVIPDYPGFGESADIIHPYLVKEPTVRSIIDMLLAVKEMDTGELPRITVNDDLFMAGYSQGGWATLSLHEAVEKNFPGEFSIRASVCGAGPYDLNVLFGKMTSENTYPMPVYIGYIINAYSGYDQFSNPVSDILREPYATRLPGLYNGTLNFSQINNQLTTSMQDLFTADFLSGFSTDPKFASVRYSLEENSIKGWKTEVPLLFIHGGGDTSVDPVTTESIYNAMIQAGTSPQLCIKEIIPELDHGDAVIPSMIRALEFLMSFR